LRLLDQLIKREKDPVESKAGRELKADPESKKGEEVDHGILGSDHGVVGLIGGGLSGLALGTHSLATNFDGKELDEGSKNHDEAGQGEGKARQMPNIGLGNIKIKKAGIDNCAGREAEWRIKQIIEFGDHLAVGGKNTGKDAKESNKNDDLEKIGEATSSGIDTFLLVKLALGLEKFGFVAFVALSEFFEFGGVLLHFFHGFKIGTGKRSESDAKGEGKADDGKAHVFTKEFIEKNETVGQGLG